MHKDFAKKRRLSHRFKGRNTKFSSSPASTFSTAWIWMSTGLLLGIGLSGVLYWKMHPKQKSPVKNQDIAINENLPSKIASAAKKNTPKRFDFYTVLAENEPKADPYYAPPPAEPMTLTQARSDRALTPKTPAIAPPDDFPLKPEIKPFKPNPSSTYRTPTSDPYVLQVGSFRHFEQAEKLRTQLAQSGFKASIQTFKMNAHETWYRVTLGPFKNRDEALQNQARLEQRHPVNSLIVKYFV